MNFSNHLCLLFFLLAAPGNCQNKRESARLQLSLSTLNVENTGCFNLAEVHLSAPELIRGRGFPLEVHSVTTKDGYILTLHRIPAPGKPPVIAMHGMFQSSRDFLMNCGRKAFGYYMWDAGYDTWLANARGSSYSRGHLTLHADRNATYWDFAVDQVAQFDVPAIIDYVLAVTSRQTVNWVGYSMGSAAIMAFATYHPQYLPKLNLAILLGTTAYVGKTKSPLMRSLAPLARIQDDLLTALNHGESLPLFTFPIMRTVFPAMCSIEAKTNTVGLCSFFLFIVAGFNKQQANPSILPMMLGGTPGSVAIKMLSQWYQWINTGKFSYYDYGKTQNVVKYGQPEPPVYDLSKFTSKVVNIWSENDWLSVPDDVQKTVNKLPNVVRNIRVSMDAWNHLDFIYGKDSDTYVYTLIVTALQEFPTSK